MRWLGHVPGRRAALKICLASASALLLPASRAADNDFSNEKSVDGMRIYLGVMPSQIVAAGAMDEHHRPPPGRGYHHVVVALFDEKTGERLTDCELLARVENLGRTVVENKPLEAMLINRLVSFGNFFSMPGADPYRIHLEIRRRHTVSRATFNYRHS